MAKTGVATARDLMITGTDDGPEGIARQARAARGLQRQSSGLPPEGAMDVPTIPPADPSGLPNISVANQVVGREIGDLRARLDGCKAALGRGVIGAAGQVVPHLVAEHEAIRDHIRAIEAEIDRLSRLSPVEARQFAKAKGYR